MKKVFVGFAVHLSVSQASNKDRIIARFLHQNGEDSCKMRGTYQM